MVAIASSPARNVVDFGIPTREMLARLLLEWYLHGPVRVSTYSRTDAGWAADFQLTLHVLEAIDDVLRSDFPASFPRA